MTVNAFNPWALVPGDGGLSIAQTGRGSATRSAIGPEPAAATAAAPARVIGPLPAVAVGSACCSRHRAGDRGRRRAPAGPTHDARRPRRARARLLRPADARPRALPVPARRARRDPRRGVDPLAPRVRALSAAATFAEHVRRPDDDLPDNPRFSATGSGSARSIASAVGRDRRRRPPAPWLGVLPAPRRRPEGLAEESPTQASIDDGAEEEPRARPGPAPEPTPPAPALAGTAAASSGRGATGPAEPSRSGRRRPWSPSATSARARWACGSARGSEPTAASCPTGAAPARERGGRLDKLDLWLLVVLAWPRCPAHVPAREPLPDALRRGLSRAHRDGVPPGLALRRRRTTSTSGPTRTWPSTRWRPGSSLRRRQGQRRELARRPGHRRGRRAPPRRHRDRRQTGERLWRRDGHEVRGYDLGRARRGRTIDLARRVALAHDPTSDRCSRRPKPGSCHARPRPARHRRASERRAVPAAPISEFPSTASPSHRTAPTVLATAGRPAPRRRFRDRRGRARRRATGPRRGRRRRAPARRSSQPRPDRRPARSPRGWPSSLGGDAADIEAQLASGGERRHDRGLGTASRRRRGRDRRGGPAGHRDRPVAQVAVADGDGVAFLDRATGDSSRRSRRGWRARPCLDHQHRRREALRDGGHRGRPTYAVVDLGRIPRTGPEHRQYARCRASAAGSARRPDAWCTSSARTPDGTATVYVDRAARELRLRRRAPAVRPRHVGLRHEEGRTMRRSPAAPRVRCGRERGDVEIGSMRSAGGCPG